MPGRSAGRSRRPGSPPCCARRPDEDLSRRCGTAPGGPYAARITPAPPRRHVACQLAFDVATASTLALQVAVDAPADRVEGEELVATLDGAALPRPEEVGTASGRVHLVRCGPGRLDVRYRASVTAAPAQPLREAPGPPVLDAASIEALRQSRFCPSDQLAGFAEVELGRLRGGPEPAAEVASWVFERLAYAAGSSGHLDTAVDTLLANAGVCRDFAHLTVALCRALGLPARLVAAYAPGLAPMDFHAVAEVRRGAGWEVVDATRLAPRSSLVRIATGRDAADTAFATTIAGEVELVATEVGAVVDGDLPADDHRAPTALR